MKFASAAALLLLLATPAFADASKTVSDVVVECAVTGSSNDGYNLTADNKKGSADRDCSATCKLTRKDGSTFEKSWSKKVSKGFKVSMGGEGSLPGSPFSSPNVTQASCR
jgi:hypothetical protein